MTERAPLPPQNNSVSLGLNVIRTWAFCDGDLPGALQPSPLQYKESTFVALDNLIASAGATGVRLVLTLTNYWSDFGGIQAYANWAGLSQKEGAHRRLRSDAAAKAR